MNKKNAALLSLLIICFGFPACEKEDDLTVRQRSYYDVIQYSPELFPVKINGRYGYINTSGNLVLEPIYYFAFPFHFDRAIIIKKDQTDGSYKYGFINSKGDVVIPLVYANANNFTSDGLAPVENSAGKWGYIDRSGKMKIDFIFQFADAFYEGLACVKMDEKYGFIDTQGNMRVPAVYFRAGFFSEGMAYVKNESGKFGFIDKAGSLKIDCIYDQAWFFNEGTAVVRKDEKYGFIKKDGSVKIDFQFDGAYPFFEGLAVVQQNNTTSIIDYDGKVVFTTNYSPSSYGFSEGYLSLQDEYHNGIYLDKKGDIKIYTEPLVWNDPFVNGVAEITYSDYSIVFINKEGEILWDSERQY